MAEKCYDRQGNTQHIFGVDFFIKENYLSTLEDMCYKMEGVEMLPWFITHKEGSTFCANRSFRASTFCYLLIEMHL
jgi:hypothetical protein